MFPSTLSLTLTSLLLLLLTLPSPSTPQFIPPPTDLIQATGHYNISVRYKPVPPGICELSPTVKSYTGYADVADDQHIFFWFFEARDVDPKEAPLTVWMNGGPGSSSMIGLFGELGPCWVDGKGVVRDNAWSWSRRSNLLVVDQPAQVCNFSRFCLEEFGGCGWFGKMETDGLIWGM